MKSSRIVTSSRGLTLWPGGKKHLGSYGFTINARWLRSIGLTSLISDLRYAAACSTQTAAGNFIETLSTRPFAGSQVCLCLCRPQNSSSR